MNIKIGFYEDWMKAQVAKMFSLQYGVDEHFFAKQIADFYEHPFQKNKCIRIVALDGDKVAGFQSFVYWPYNYGETTYNSYQSGNSLVHQDYRGKGIFNKLLSFFETEKIDIDFLVGFPVEMSKNNFLKDKWQNILNLSWYLKLLNPFAFLVSPQGKKLNKYFATENSTSIHEQREYFRLNNTPEFVQWRKEYSKHNNYYYYEYEDNGKKVVFELKFNKRKKIINELIIGNIQFNDSADIDLSKALKALLKKISKTMCITVVSIALNEDFEHSIVPVLKKNTFKKLSKNIYFIVKPQKVSDLPLKKEKWSLYRSDLDTW